MTVGIDPKEIAIACFPGGLIRNRYIHGVENARRVNSQNYLIEFPREIALRRNPSKEHEGVNEHFDRQRVHPGLSEKAISRSHSITGIVVGIATEVLVGTTLPSYLAAEMSKDNVDNFIPNFLTTYLAIRLITGLYHAHSLSQTRNLTEEIEQKTKNLERRI